MKILALDTSSNVATAAVLDGVKLMGEFTINHKKNHSIGLMPMIGHLLDSLELKPGEIDLFAASSGPGSFTGLRIGVTTVKAMAYAAGKPTVSVPTLDALAYNLITADGLICPMLDARNNQVFTAIYRPDGENLVRATDYLGIPVIELLQILKNLGGKVFFLGDGAELHRQMLTDELKDACGFAPMNLMHQRASSVAVLAERMASAGNLESPYDMVPFYLRKSQAERERELRHNEA